MTDPISLLPAPAVAPRPAPTAKEPAATEDFRVPPPLQEVAAQVRRSLSGTGLADRVTPELLAEILRMSPDGELALDDQERVQLRDPGAASREHEIIFGAVRHALETGGDDGAADGPADFVENVTGYRRVEMGGGLHTYVDADGEGAAADGPVWQLGPLLEARHRAGLDADGPSRDWFSDWAANLPNGVSLPAGWAARAEAWFARREAPEETV